MSPIERDLDRALAGRTEPDQDTAPLIEVARRLEGMMDMETPDARRERTLFATAVATRKRPTLWRYLGPAVAVTSLLAAVYFAGRAATPGNALYPVRKALQQVDLAPRVSETVQTRLLQIDASLDEAGIIMEDAPIRAGQIATDALKSLGAVESQIAELPVDQRGGPQGRVDDLEERAIGLLALSIDEEEPGSVDALEDRLDEMEDRRDDRRDAREDRRDERRDGARGGDDRSGSGGSDDNSGSGSGDDS